MQDETRRCRAMRKDGTQCRAEGPTVDPASGLCWAHDPSHQTRREDARRRGGLNSAKHVRVQQALPPRLRTMLDTLLTTFEETGTGDEPVSRDRVYALTALAGAILKVYQAVETDERLQRLEEVAATFEKERRWDA